LSPGPIRTSNAGLLKVVFGLAGSVDVGPHLDGAAVKVLVAARLRRDAAHSQLFRKKKNNSGKKKNTFLHHFLKFLEVNIW
jgi:hypothetical protein